MRGKVFLTACGIITAIIWLCVTFITKGIPLAFSRSVGRFVPGFINAEVMKTANGFYYDVSNSQMPQAVFLVLFSMAFLIYLVSIFIVRRKGLNFVPLIVFFAVLFRFSLLPGEAIHENDIYRYIWDGKVLLSGINPYKYAPDEAGGLHRREDASGRGLLEIERLSLLKDQNRRFFYRIGHRAVPTIYPPFAQAVFGASNIIKRDSIFVMKSIFVIFDILTIFVIYRILILLRMNPNMLIVYAWSPLVLKEFANSGHLDPMPVFFMLCALFFALRRKGFFSAASLSSGILCKLFPCVTAPLFLRKNGFRYLGWVLVFTAAGYLPFFLMGGIGVPEIFKGLLIYGREWAINGGIFEALYSIISGLNLKTAFSTEILAKMIVGLCYLTALFLIYRGRIGDDRDFIHRAFLSIACLFLLSPVGDPWYFCWVIPFLCFFPYYSFIVLSWLLIFSYISFIHDLGSVRVGRFAIDKLTAVQYLPFFIMVFLEALCIRAKRCRC